MTLAPDLNVAIATVLDLATVCDLRAMDCEREGRNASGLRDEAACLRVVAAAARAGLRFREDVSVAVGDR